MGGVDIPVWQLYRARNKAKEEYQGTHSGSFRILKKWVELLLVYNP